MRLYLELAKPVLIGEEGAAKSETRAMVAWHATKILKLLHPFMPFSPKSSGQLPPPMPEAVSSSPSPLWGRVGRGVSRELRCPQYPLSNSPPQGESWQIIACANSLAHTRRPHR